MDRPVQKIKKLDAASRQLTTAIRLFFERRDAVSIHTLAAASFEVYRDICKKKGLRKSLFVDSDKIRPDKIKEWLKIVRKPANFFKHADEDPDPDGTVEYSEMLTEILLLDSVFFHKALTGNMNVAMNVFYAWFLVKYPQFFLDEEFKRVHALYGRRVNPEDYGLFLEFLKTMEIKSRPKLSGMPKLQI